MKNKDLVGVYDKAYKVGKFFTFGRTEEPEAILSAINDWRGRNVLEIGCGEGGLSKTMAGIGAKVLGCDYSQEAIDNCPANTLAKFICCDYRDIDSVFDTVVLQGVLEHLDNPYGELEWIIENLLSRGGVCITSSPSFYNMRGAIWKTLELLFDVPMSLTDLHTISISDMKTFCEIRGYSLDVRTCDHNWGCGDKTVFDYDKRLRNALRDANMESSGIDRLLAWMKDAKDFFPHGMFMGANAVYKIRGDNGNTRKGLGA